MKILPYSVTRAIGRTKLNLGKNSPTIMLTAGIVGVVGTTVLAGRATLKAQPVMEATHMELEALKYEAEKTLAESGLRIDEADLRKKRVNIYAHTGVQLVKLYAPTVILGTLSIGAIVGSHKMLNDRYSNLAAAYVSLQEGLEAYRKRVRDEIGEEKERETWLDVQEGYEIVPGPNGPKKEKTRFIGDGGGSIYGKFFGPDNPNWKTTPEYNTMFLRQVEEHLNRKLRTDGHLFLNRVYEELGMSDTSAGAVCGWLYECGTGDNYVDFGIWDGTEKDRMYDFMVGNVGEIYLDFNVDGEIYERLGMPKVKR